MSQDSVTVSQAASRLGLSVDSIRRLCAAGKLPAFTTGGGHLRIPVEVIESYRQPRHGAPSDSAPSGGPSPALKNLQERIKERELRIQERKLARDERKLDEEDAEEKAQRQLQQAEEQGAAREVQRTQAQQAQREKEQADLRRWRADMLEEASSFYIPDGAPPAVVTPFVQKVRTTLAGFDSARPQAVMDALFAATADEVFGPWRREQQAQAEGARLAEQERARAAWLQKQQSDAWHDLLSAWPYGLPRDDEAARVALVQAISSAMQNLGPGSGWWDLSKAREHAVASVLAPLREEEQRQRKNRQAVEAGVCHVGPYLQKLGREGCLDLDAGGIKTLIELKQPQVRSYLEAQVVNQELSETQAIRLTENFILESERLV